MADDPGSQHTQQDSGAADTSRANMTRVYDYLLGGKDNFDIDRTVAERAYSTYPGGIPGARRHLSAQRDFLKYAVTFAAREGISQFLDVGMGIPSYNNTQDCAREVHPNARVVHIDSDPTVLLYARVLLGDDASGATSFVEAPLDDPHYWLDEASHALDFQQPIAVTLLRTLYLLPDGAATRVMTALTKRLPPGSYVVLGHLASDILPEFTTGLQIINEATGTVIHSRTHAEVMGLVGGLELLEPGMVQVHRWRRKERFPQGDAEFEDTTLPEHEEVPLYAAVAHKPSV